LFDRDGKRKYLNRSERKAYFQAASSEGNLAERTFCLALYYTGCRISEGLNLTPQRVDLRGKTVVFETMKQRSSGHFRSVPIPESFAQSLGQHLSALKDSEFVWTFSRTTAFRLVKAGMRRAEITGAMASPKGLRHGFAVACITNNIPLPTVQKWLGHARLETTAIYLDATGDEEREFAKRLWADG
jgi:integrase/recombinase XerD